MHSKDYFRVHFLILPLPNVSQVRLGASGDWLAYVRGLDANEDEGEVKKPRRIGSRWRSKWEKWRAGS